MGRNILGDRRPDLVDHVREDRGKRPRELVPDEVDVIRVVVGLAPEDVPDLQELPSPRTRPTRATAAKSKSVISRVGMVRLTSSVLSMNESSSSGRFLTSSSIWGPFTITIHWSSRATLKAEPWNFGFGFGYAWESSVSIARLVGRLNRMAGRYAPSRIPL